MAAHHRAHSLRRAEVLGVRQLVELVRADTALAGDLAVPVDVRRRRSKERHACARERNLRRRAHHPEAIRVVGFGRVIQYRVDVREVLVQGVDRVGVVPHDAEVRRGGLHGSELAYDLLAVGHTGRIRERRHRPHALDLRVFHQLAHAVQIRAVLAHGDVDHLEAKELRDRMVAVVARDRADPLDLLLLRPRPIRVRRTEGVGPGDEVKLDVERRGISGQEVFGTHVEQIRPQVADVRDALQVAVVTEIVSLRVGVVVTARHLEEVGCEIELLLRRLAAREVQLQLLAFQLFVIALDLVLQFRELVRGQFMERHEEYAHPSTRKGNRMSGTS